MNERTKLELIRNLVTSRIMEVLPFAGEEMNLPQTDAHREGFVDGERALAAQILKLIDEKETESEAAEEEMVLGR